MPKAKESLSDRVRSAINRTGLTLSVFADEAKIKKRTLEDILHGISQDPQISTLQGVSKRSGISLDQLVFGASIPTPDAFKEVATFLSFFAGADSDTKTIVLAVLYDEPEKFREASRSGLDRTLKLLSSAIKPK